MAPRSVIIPVDSGQSTVIQEQDSQKWRADSANAFPTHKSLPSGPKIFFLDLHLDLSCVPTVSCTKVCGFKEVATSDLSNETKGRGQETYRNESCCNELLRRWELFMQHSGTLSLPTCGN